jgi:ParB family transcriptional regulator, chromosome partitioning protein
MTAQKPKQLGRGLAALLGDPEKDLPELDQIRATKPVPIEFLRPGKYQPRRIMNSDHIEELADSIRDKGIIQPIIVRRHPDDPKLYEIIAGERRWRAGQVAKLHEVPIIIKDFNDLETLEVALIENLQRQDLSPLEEAEGYQRLMDEFGHTQEIMAKGIGKSRSHVANMVRLLSLPEDVKTMIDDGQLSAGHARALIGAVDESALARLVVSEGLNVRETERLCKDVVPTRSSSRPPAKDSDTIALERDLTNILGLNVSIASKGQSGALTLKYKTLDQLEDVLRRLGYGSEG